jgi:hypothetical protein
LRRLTVAERSGDIRTARRFIREFEAQYQIPAEWDVIRVLLVEDRPTGTGTASKRVYTCLCEEVESNG